MLCESVLIDREDTCWVEREVVRLVEGDALRCTIDIHTFHRSVTLHDTLTGGVVSVTTRLAIIREYHHSIVFVPVHLTGSIRRVVRYQCWITVGIIRVMVVTNLCWSRRMVTVLVFISEVITLGCVRRVYLLDLRQRLAHPAEGHCHVVTGVLRLACSMNQSV